MAIIPKKVLSRIKMFLISNFLEKFLLCSFIIVVLTILSIHYFSKANNNQIREISFSFNLYKQFREKAKDYDSFINFLSSDIYTNFLKSKNLILKIFGSARIVSYQFKLDLNCFSNSSNLKLQKYKLDCNPLFETNFETKFLKNYIKKPTNTQNCVLNNCEEFNIKHSNVILKTELKTYPKNAFIIDIPISDPINYKQILSKIKSNGWIANETFLISFDFNLIELISKSIYSYKLIMEKPAANIFIQTFTKKKISYYEKGGGLIIFVIPFYLIIIIIYLTKIIFICNLIQSISNFINFLFVLIDLGTILSFMMEYSQFIQKFNEDFLNYVGLNYLNCYYYI